MLTKIEFVCECEKDILLVVQEDEIDDVSFSPFCGCEIDLQEKVNDE